MNQVLDITISVFTQFELFNRFIFSSVCGIYSMHISRSPDLLLESLTSFILHIALLKPERPNGRKIYSVF